jgi:hypothetical protein
MKRQILSNGWESTIIYGDREFKFTTSSNGDWPELLAQGRLWENAQRKKAIRALPFFVNTGEALEYVLAGSQDPYDLRWLGRWKRHVDCEEV